MVKKIYKKDNQRHGIAEKTAIDRIYNHEGYFIGINIFWRLLLVESEK